MSSRVGAPAGVYGRARGLKRLTLWWAAHPGGDLAVAAVVVVSWAGWDVLASEPLFITGFEAAARRAIFQTLTTVSATFAGFALASVSILINLLSTEVATVSGLTDPRAKARVGEVFLAAIRMLGVAFVACLFALLVDSTGAGGRAFVEGVAYTAIVAALSALARVVWVLSRLLALGAGRRD